MYIYIRFLSIAVLSVLLCACQPFLGSDADLSKEKVLIEFSFLKKDNPQLENDIVLNISDRMVTGRVPHNAKIDSLISTFKLAGKTLSVNDIVQTSGVSSVDYSNVVKCMIEAKNGSVHVYHLDLTLFTGLPILYINTDRAEDITKRGSYEPGSLKCLGGRNHKDFNIRMNIKGRGNTTWKFPKKSFRIKTDEKFSVLGMPKNKNWVLLANYSDKTMLRNKTGFLFGKTSVLDWTPKSFFAEVFMNNEYAGTYQIVQKVEKNKKKVNIGADGYLLEVDQRDRLKHDDVYFDSCLPLFNIHEPKIEKGSTKYNIIKKQVRSIESILYGDTFKDPEIGYRKYLDVETFVDWYLINEIAKNNDAAFFSSVFMYMDDANKLKMGPVWDFDIAYGNINYNGNDDPCGLFVKDSPWLYRLFQDPYFVEKIKTRFQYFKSKKDIILTKITDMSQKLGLAQKENDKKWDLIGRRVWPNPVVFDTYKEEVDHLIDWIEKRFVCLEREFDAL